MSYRATQYSTWKQPPVFTADGKLKHPAVYFIILNLWFKEAELTHYTLLNLNGQLDTIDLTPEKFNQYLTDKKIVEWKPG